MTAVLALPMPPIGERRIRRVSRLTGTLVATERYMMWRNACRPVLVRRLHGISGVAAIDATFDRMERIDAATGEQRPVSDLMRWIEMLLIDERIFSPQDIVGVSAGWGFVDGVRLRVEYDAHQLAVAV